jgi:hypothetical protein
MLGATTHAHAVPSGDSQERVSPAGQPRAAEGGSAAPCASAASGQSLAEVRRRHADAELMIGLQ